MASENAAAEEKRHGYMREAMCANAPTSFPRLAQCGRKGPDEKSGTGEHAYLDSELKLSVFFSVVFQAF